MVRDVDRDDVAVAEEGDRAADRRLGRNVADRRAAGGAGEPAVGDQRDGRALAAALDGRGGGQHLPHAGAALRAFVADDDDVAVVDEAGIDGGLGLFLRVKAAGRAFVHQHFGGDGRPFDDAGVGGEVAAEDGNAAGLGVGVVGRANDLGVEIHGVLDVLGDGMPGDGHQVGMEEAQVGDLLHDSVDAAGGV